MPAFKTTILAACLAALAGCASWDTSPICPKTHGWQAWNDVRCNPPEPTRDLAAELAAAQNENQSLGLRLSGVKGLLADSQRDLAACRAAK
jgi:hypothetical protein